MTKAELRKIYKQKRQLLFEQELQQRSQDIGKMFFKNFQVEKLRTLHVFLPILRHKEPDTWPIIRKIWQEHTQLQVLVSVSALDTPTMKHFLFTPDTKLTENPWGIPEVQEAQLWQQENIDMVLIPLLAFDQQGYRVGYGKGYYDRFLSTCRPLKVGISLEPPVRAITDVEPTDQAMHYCITPERIYDFVN